MEPGIPTGVRARAARKAAVGLRELLDSLLTEVTRHHSRGEALRRIATVLVQFSGCDALTARIDDRVRPVLCRARVLEDGSDRVDTLLVEGTDLQPGPADDRSCLIPQPILDNVLSGAVATDLRTRGGSFWIGDAARPILLHEADGPSPTSRTVVIGGEYPSIAVIPFPAGYRARGFLCLASRRQDFFSRDEIQLYEAVAQAVGVALAHQGAQWALGERVKELTCLYGIAQVAGRPGIAIDEFLQEAVSLLPPGWQYPDITEARITLDGRDYSTQGFRDGASRQHAEVRVGGVLRGTVVVTYTERRPRMDEGPFLKEERSLINEIARQVGFFVEHWEKEVEAVTLQEQLRHADRLATVGQLAAGVAHELNEPLGAVLGFAELIGKSADLPEQVARDVDKIFKAALHAREIIRKLMIFTRQMPSRRVLCDLNQLVRDGLDLLATRCAKEGIELSEDLEPALPPIVADTAQLQQVLVNLIVNAIQAMPGGGALSVRTRSGPGTASLFVNDTGTGMTPEVQKQLFLPFFTTKDVGHGTGLGLAVVHGIVVAHGGTVLVKSEVGRGSSFEVRLPTADVVPSAPLEHA
jgi:signal transduction histidine kinase